jgi:uncharacterized protein (DUF952 family)
MIDPRSHKPEDSLIFKIDAAQAWQQAVRAGVYRGSLLDEKDGFIHFSTLQQVPGTLHRYFAHRTDLVLIAVRAPDLGVALRWEPSRDGALFPHLYGPLPMTAVVGWRPIDAGGALPAAEDWGLP